MWTQCLTNHKNPTTKYKKLKTINKKMKKDKKKQFQDPFRCGTNPLVDDSTEKLYRVEAFGASTCEHHGLCDYLGGGTLVHAVLGGEGKSVAGVFFLSFFKGPVGGCYVFFLAFFLGLFENFFEVLTTKHILPPPPKKKNAAQKPKTSSSFLGVFLLFFPKKKPKNKKKKQKKQRKHPKNTKKPKEPPKK